MDDSPLSSDVRYLVEVSSTRVDACTVYVRLKSCTVMFVTSSLLEHSRLSSDIGPTSTDWGVRYVSMHLTEQLLAYKRYGCTVSSNKCQLRYRVIRRCTVYSNIAAIFLLCTLMDI